MGEQKVLIVDDEVDILDMMKEAFSMQGYAVFAAGSAEEALEMLKQDSVMVMFFDLKLPGMSGIDLCRRIRRENQIAVIHALTGYTNFFGLLECRSVGFDDFFTKPVDLQILLKAAKDAFEKIERWKVVDYELV
jgi:DNA-binding response OmpR family regulator